MVSEADAFRASVLATLGELKRARNDNPPRCIQVPLRVGPALVLRPVNLETGPATDRDVALITAWRNRHRESFLTWFTATEEGTRRWLHDIGEAGDRILFMIEADGTAFGHVGVRDFDFLARTCEIDAVARGRDDLWPGAMTLAVRGLLTWLFEQLHCVGAFVRVFADNESACALYERCGFTVVQTVPIEAVTEGRVVRWVEQAEPANGRSDRRLAYMAVSAPPDVDDRA